jgi:hypothetical protein
VDGDVKLTGVRPCEFIDFIVIMHFDDAFLFMFYIPNLCLTFPFMNF